MAFSPRVGLLAAGKEGVIPRASSILFSCRLAPLFFGLDFKRLFGARACLGIHDSSDTNRSRSTRAGGDCAKSKTGGGMDIARGEATEKELDQLIVRRHEKRVVDEGERPAQEMYEESCRKYAESAREARLWEKLHFAKSMRRSHIRNFAELDAKYSRMISDLEAQLGLPEKGRHDVVKPEVRP